MSPLLFNFIYCKKSLNILLLTLCVSSFVFAADKVVIEKIEVIDHPEVALISAPVVVIETEKEKKKFKKEPIKWVFGDSTLELSARVRAEMFYGKNLSLLNDKNCDLDKILVPIKHTFDIGSIYGYGCQRWGHDIVRMKMSLRTKGTWGAPETIASTEEAPVKIADVVTGPHSHVISRNILWIRELWLESTINEMFGFEEKNWRHTISMGYLPFLVGRGIALGDAYATDPDLLGYYSPSAIDQYAPGIRFTGEDVRSKWVSYDLYLAILNNKSNTFNNVNLNIRGQQYGHRNFQQRGFGVINWLFAARAKFFPVNNDFAEVVIEPYILYDEEKEQKVVFLGDSDGKLATAGLAFEASVSAFECGFDFAHNFGRQKVKGWDRNVIEMIARNGLVTDANTAVTAIAAINGETAGQGALFTPANQAIIDTSVQSEAQNGQIIGENLMNKSDRFNDAYTNHYKGWMMVGDMGYTIFDGFKMCAGGGVASGDENPNKNLELADGVIKDVDYKGFISLQELYAGTRLRSAFFLSGAGKVPRLLSFPSPELGTEFPQTVSRFTNIKFVGWSAWYERKTYNINTNVLAYWQQHALSYYPKNISSGASLSTQRMCASKWLGVETNLFADVTLANNIKCYFIGSVFIPGQHYKDITGLPLNKPQQKYLDRDDATGNNVNFVPTVGHDVAYTINMGVEYKF